MPILRIPLVVFCALLAAVGPLAVAQAGPSLVLQGVVHASQAQTYLEVPFQVPSGVHRVSVNFENPGKGEGTVLDLGIADPYRFRGESGSNKHYFTIGESDATPSYLAGPIPSGRWKLLIAVPNIRKGVTSNYRAEIYFNRAIDDSSFTVQPLRDQPGWYRGDLHMHTAHSDGSCPSATGEAVPCPLFVTVEAAARRGLDFIAISDHNTTSHYDAMRELQPYFDKTLLIPARELTTFHGHANMYGSTRYVNFQVGTRAVPNIDTLFRNGRSVGAMISINHPEAPTGAICMGCGWNPDPAVDMSLVTAIEVMNGGGKFGFLSSLEFWQEQLAKGYRPTAVGGSDNHHADWPASNLGSVGNPMTVVHASNLSVAAILDGIRAGHVFLDLTSSPDKLIDLHAQDADGSASMGDELQASPGERVDLEIHVTACRGATAQLLVDGKILPGLPKQLLSNDDQVLSDVWTSDGARHWLRAEVRDAGGRLLLLGNPVYLNFYLHQN